MNLVGFHFLNCKVREWMRSLSGTTEVSELFL